jgi:hypothetical protein
MQYRGGIVSIRGVDCRHSSLLISSFSAFTDIYNKDKGQFGDLAKSGLKVTELREVDGWQTVLQAHARLVESPNQKKRKLSTFEE